MALKNAKIIVSTESGNETITCAFNPAEYSITSKANYSEADISPQNMLAFHSVALKELKVQLFFSSVPHDKLYHEGYEADPVTNITQKIIKALHVSGTEHRPPLVTFQWGNLNFKGFLTFVEETYTMFDIAGKPVRCKLNIVLKESRNSTLSKVEEPFSSPDRTKWFTMTDSMSLWQLAYKEYGDAEKWRLIATANNIKNPLHVKTGQVIQVPAL